mmetsp:Transcript_9341/g.27210  ORF Transcript_9341/g.27210 Transcript_9341/m.27210 type:complete len:653 (+) Transcript_9341:73-2031(+)
MLMRAVGKLVSAAMVFFQILMASGTRLMGSSAAAGTNRALFAHSRAYQASAPSRLLSGVSRIFSSIAGDPLDPLQPPPGQAPMSDAALKEALALHERMSACDDPQLGPPVKEALTVLGDAIRLYGPASVFGSFNGGKDAVVIFHLLRAALAAHNAATGSRVKPQLIYFHHEKEFPEVEAFVEDAVTKAEAQLFTYDLGIVDGLRAHLNAQRDAGMAGVFAFVLGTRMGDPNSKGQTAFAPSSAWMPPFMRVNPVLSWDYGLVWKFLRDFELPYCSLYDRGYTSLGTVEDTEPNPALARPRGDGYYPAWMLEDWSLERAGRKAKPKPKEAEAQAETEATQGTAPRAGDSADAAKDGAGASGDPAASRSEALLPRAQGESEPAAAPGPRRSVAGRRTTSQAQTVGVVIIGDEILKGKVADVNAPYAIGAMRKRGLDVRRVGIVPDTLEEIEREVRAQAQTFDVVVTSGGVGPTHDDVTIKAVAEALGRPIERNEQMAKMIEAACGSPLSEEQAKMALLPAGVRLRTVPGSGAKWPILQAENVFVLPGVPAYFSSKLDAILTHFIDQNRSIFTRQLVLNVIEEDIVADLNTVVADYPAVAFGSYPVLDDPEFKTIVTLEGEDEKVLSDAFKALSAKMRPGAVVRRPSTNLEHMLK